MERFRPTLSATCAVASSAAEARFRVDYPNSRTRTTRIFALDADAAAAMATVAEAPWFGAHFLTIDLTGDVDPEQTQAADLTLVNPEGTQTRLDREVEGADVVVLISSQGVNAGAAEVIAREAYNRNIMTAGLVLENGRAQSTVNRVVNTLRPFASVLVVASDNDFIAAMLSALRA